MRTTSTRRPALAILAVAGALALSGCFPIAPSPVSSPTSATRSAEPTPSAATATASPLASPVASPVGLPGFVTPVPPDAGKRWSGITWRKLAAEDPLAQVRSVVRWRSGFVAVGAVIATGETSRTPVWVSTDGATWRPLDVQVLGPATVVIGVGETADGIVALTLQGGANQCDGQDAPLGCWALSEPLQAWTSSDATSWTSHPGPPGIALPGVGCDGCGVDVPILRLGTPGLLVVNQRGGTERVSSRAAFSPDGIAWEELPADAFPAGFQFGDVAGFRSGFIAVGDNGRGPGRAMALSSSDGRDWVSRYLPTSGLDPQAGTTANRVAVGPEGLIVMGSDQLTPGRELWWSSVSGSSWLRVSGYAPLGVWTGEGQGTGLMADGTLLGDGERMLAYRGGDTPAAWTSLDGRSWQTIAIGGTPPKGNGTLVLMPTWVLEIGYDGSSWFGRPVP